MAEPTADYYAVLGVSPSASEQEIRHAFRRRARELHPDHNPDQSGVRPGAPDMRLVNEAWSVLRVRERRAAYDQQRRGMPRPATRPFAGGDRGATSDLPPVPPGFGLYPKETWQPRVFSYLDSAYDWKYRAHDARQRALSLFAETTDLSNLSSLGANDVWLLDLRGLPVTDPHLLPVARLRRLEQLLIESPRVTDRGLEVLQVLPRLNTISLIGCGITDGGLRTLRSMESLHTVILFETGVSDAGVAALAGHPRLTILDIRHTQVEGDGMRHLAEVPTLRELRIPRRAHRAAQRAFKHRPEVLLIW